MPRDSVCMYLNKLCKLRITLLFQLKVEFANELVRTVSNKRMELTHVFQHDIADIGDNRLLLLSCDQGLCELRVDFFNVCYVPKYFLNEMLPPL